MHQFLKIYRILYEQLIQFLLFNIIFYQLFKKYIKKKRVNFIFMKLYLIEINFYFLIN